MVTLAECQSICEHLEDLEEEGDKGIFLTENLKEFEEGPNEGEILVVRKALSGLATPENQEQRKAIFHTRCTVGGKICSMIIDGGSYTNIVSKTLVGKLKLPTIPYPSSYTIQWLNQGKCIQISSKYLVSL